MNTKDECRQSSLPAKVNYNHVDTSATNSRWAYLALRSARPRPFPTTATSTQSIIASRQGSSTSYDRGSVIFDKFCSNPIHQRNW